MLLPVSRLRLGTKALKPSRTTLSRNVSSASTQKPNRILVSHCVDPYWNLAFEHHLLESKRKREDGGKWLFLWRNSPSVILGRHQNPWAECNLAFMKENGIPLVRRQSGGGTVYHDLGNTCVTIFGEKHEPARNLQFACEVLQQSFGLAAYVNPRNDVCLDGFKISGSAFRITNKAAFHHFTLLRSTDMSKLTQSLLPLLLDMDSKATASVRSKVLNLSERDATIDHEALCTAFTSHFARTFPNGDNNESTEIEVWSTDAIMGLEDVQKERANLVEWDFLYGRTPEFTNRLRATLGKFEVLVTVTVLEGRITNAVTEIEPHDFEIANATSLALAGLRYNKEEIETALLAREHTLTDDDARPLFSSIRQWLAESIFS